MSNVLEDPSINDKLVTLTGTASLDKRKLIHGAGVQRWWVESNSKFLDVIGSRYAQSVKASLEAGEVIVTEVDESLLPKFNTDDEMKAHVQGLKFWEQEQHAQAKEKHNHFRMGVRQRLSTVCGVLYSLCDSSVRNRLEAESDYQIMS